MRNPISEFHPLAVFLYFMTAVGITILWNQPQFLLVSFLIAFGYACALEKGKNIFRSLVWLLPVMALPVIINPLVNHRGNTPLLYINDQPITLEAVLYGLFTGVMIAAMLFWFQAYSKSLDSDGFLYLFGKRFPVIALMITMIFRFVPQFHRSLQEIGAVQKTLGVSTSRGTLRQRLRAGGKLLSALVSVTLEDSLQTADSMNARGYGLPGKTRSRKIRFTLRDGILLAASLGELTFFFLLWCWGKLDFYYFPALAGSEPTPAVTVFFLVTCLYFLIPIFVFIGEAIQWLFLKSKISHLPIQKSKSRL